VKRVLILVGLIVLLPYARTAVYEFPSPVPFTGASFFNPYQGGAGTWQRANLHAHGRPWAGMTTGRQTAQEVITAYHRAGYSVAGISDYQHIAAYDGLNTIPLYEHGYNLGKRHQLGVGARRVVWFDFPLGQSIGQQQLIIDLVARESELVAIAHPEGRDAYTVQDMQRLTGYHLLEVVNGPFVGERSWDAALSAGRAVWAVANDDNHDLNERRRFAAAWNMIDAPSASAADIVKALRAGRTYAVLRTDEIPTARETTVKSVTFDAGVLRVRTSGEPATIVFIGQDGVERRRVQRANHAEYAVSDGDTYVRTVVYSPRSVMFLNPVLRYDGRAIPAPMARIAVARTWAMRGSVVAAVLALAVLIRRRRRLSSKDSGTVRPERSDPPSSSARAPTLEDSLRHHSGGTRESGRP
jgi:hypothetical protein